MSRIVAQPSIRPVFRRRRPTGPCRKVVLELRAVDIVSTVRILCREVHSSPRIYESCCYRVGVARGLIRLKIFLEEI